MATYPQGVSSFIPDYQPYEPDLNFTANVLQLKQTQYDQNWSKLNNIYGQIVNAPLSHSESAKRRSNTINAIDFDLKRITGLDLSLDQNVHQATQIFRPFYEDKNLMKDIAFTKNAQYERTIGEGRRLSTDEKIRSEYWDGGLRYIDEKIRDFQALPYDKLTTFGDVRYVPYINVEKKAFELAEKLDYTIDRVTPTGEWMIRERNGKQVIPRLQSVFYSILGKDPMIQQMYGAQAYLKRKDFIASNQNNPEFGGDPVAAERNYLENAVKMLETQTQVIKSGVQDDRNTNNNRIKRLEAQIKSGDNSAETASELDRLRKANQINDDNLQDAESNLDKVSNNRNGTLTTQGGSDLSFDDLENMRNRVDAVMASTLLQADLNQASLDVAYKDYLLDYEANPYGVQRQKYLYDVDLMNRRKDAQKEVEDYKAGIEKKKFIDEARLKSGLYYRDLDNGEVKMKPEFVGAHKMGIVSNTDSADPNKQQELNDNTFKKSATKVKENMRKVLEKMMNEGQLSAGQIRYILGDKVAAAGFDMVPFLKWLETSAGEKNGPVPENIRKLLQRQGMYTTKLEMEEQGQTVGMEEAKAQLLSLALGDLDNVSPEYLQRMTTRLGRLINNMSADDKVKMDNNITTLNEASYDIDNYVEYKKAVNENKKKVRDEVVNKLKKSGYQYADAMFDEDNNMIATNEEFVRNAMVKYGDDIALDNGMSWNGFANAVMTSATAGGIAGTALLGPAGAVPGFGSGAASAAIAYPVSGLLEWGYNALFGEGSDGGIDGSAHTFANPKQSWTGSDMTIVEEFSSMKEQYDKLVENSEIKTPAFGVATQPIQGGGTGYVAEATGVFIMPGARGPEYNQWLELQGIIDNNLDLQQPSANNFVSFTGPKEKFDGLSSSGSTFETDENVADKQYKKFKTIYDDLKMTTATAKAGEDTQPERFEVGVSPYASGQVGKSSIVIRMPKSFLDKYYDSKTGEGFLTKNEYDDILKNGFNIITDTKKLNQTTMYQNAYMTPDEVSIKRAGSEGKTYQQWNRPGYSVNYKFDQADDNNTYIQATKTFPVYMGPGQPYVINQSFDNVRLGSNIGYDRSKFFNEFALKIEMLNRQQEQQYGTAGQPE